MLRGEANFAVYTSRNVQFKSINRVVNGDKGYRGDQ